MAKAKTPRGDTVSTLPARKSAQIKEFKKSPSPNGNVEEEIRFRAYELYEQRGREGGYAHDDWLRAEAEILARFANRTA